jgi:hypothetical protein
MLLWCLEREMAARMRYDEHSGTAQTEPCLFETAYKDNLRGLSKASSCLDSLPRDFLGSEQWQYYRAERHFHSTCVFAASAS